MTGEHPEIDVDGIEAAKAHAGPLPLRQREPSLEEVRTLTLRAQEASRQRRAAVARRQQRRILVERCLLVVLILAAAGALLL